MKPCPKEKKMAGLHQWEPKGLNIFQCSVCLKYGKLNIKEKRIVEQPD